jgi:hypothetical protein
MTLRKKFDETKKSIRLAAKEKPQQVGAISLVALVLIIAALYVWWSRGKLQTAAGTPRTWVRSIFSFLAALDFAPFYLFYHASTKYGFSPA